MYNLLRRQLNWLVSSLKMLKVVTNVYIFLILQTENDIVQAFSHLITTFNIYNSKHVNRINCLNYPPPPLFLNGIPVHRRVTKHYFVKFLWWFLVTHLLSLVLICCRTTCDIAAVPTLPGILLRYKNIRRQQQQPLQTFLPANLQSWLEFNFAGTSVVKACNGRCCQWHMFWYVLRVSQAVPVAMSQVVRWHMRTTLSTWHTRQWGDVR